MKVKDNCVSTNNEQYLTMTCFEVILQLHSETSPDNITELFTHWTYFQLLVWNAIPLKFDTIVDHDLYK